MDNSFRQQVSKNQQQTGSLLAASLQFFDGILNWLAGLFELTEEEQQDAGIYLGGQRDE